MAKTKATNAKKTPTKTPTKEHAAPVTLTAEDFGPNETARKLTKAQLRAIVNMTHFRATLMREQNKWSPEEEAAFLNGAMSALLACRSGDAIPVYWIMNFGGGSILDKLARWKSEGRCLDYGRRGKKEKK